LTLIVARRGITVHLRTGIRSVDGESGAAVRIVTDVPDGDGIVEGTDLLVCVGRTQAWHAARSSVLGRVRLVEGPEGNTGQRLPAGRLAQGERCDEKAPI
jgi:hypothetical protein